MIVLTLVFWFLALVIVTAALGVVFLKNIVHSALCLIVAFLGVAGIFLTLQAEFLAMVQVLVYGGAVSVLIIFAVMLIQKGDMQGTNLFGRLRNPGIILSLVFLALLAWFVNSAGNGLLPGDFSAGTVRAISELMLTQFVIPFEVAAILLLAAMVGAIIVAREVRKP